MEVDAAVSLAIAEAVKAGVFRRAARTNPKSAAVWKPLAEDHSRRAATLLNDAMQRLDADCGGPCSRCGW